MFKRLFWLAVGLGMGFGVSFWVTRFLRQAAARYSPERLGDDLAGAVRGLSADLRAAVSEGREAMRERESELRERLGPQS
ncbi:MAG: hypothetical protein M3396_09705 [Actinomycetota bacterium]|nr:hypothetical protein [Actinomycetota bacterium]MDQ3575081.1 hypothetical protein [Actinomycetota bacterium]